MLSLDALLSGLRLYVLSNDFFILLIKVSFMPYGLLPHLQKYEVLMEKSEIVFMEWIPPPLPRDFVEVENVKIATEKCNFERC